MSPSTIPVGTLMAFGGPVPNQPLTEAGWVACDGHPYVVAGSALAAVVGNNYGGDGTSVFNVPDLRGQFIRGTSHGVSVDPERKGRTASHTGGATGDSTGSAQGWATGTPKKPFTAGPAGAHDHNIGGIPLDYHNIAVGASGPAAREAMDWNADTMTSSPGGQHAHGVIGGDAETRPANVYVNWLVAGAPVGDPPPVGSIVPFAGDSSDRDVEAALVEAGWYPCDGSSLRRHKPENKALFDVIGTTYGGDTLNFLLPDGRGYFVIGAGGGQTAGANPPYTTRMPRTTPFATDTAPAHTHTLDGLPTDGHTIDVVMGWEQASLNQAKSPTSGVDDHTHKVSGGDSESRPINVYVDYIIRFQ
jgi:microcystin-dependent protein